MQSIVKAKLRRGERSAASAFGVGIAGGFTAELLLLLIASALTSGGVIAEGSAYTAAVICAVLSSFVGSLLGAMIVPKLVLPAALGVGAALCAVNFALGMLLADGAGFSAVMPAAFIGGAVLAGVVGAVKKGGK